MKLSGSWLTSPATQAVCRMLQDGGHQALFVGGCVRNALLGAPVNDIDISTDARPERVLDLAQAAGLNAIPTGIDHGTVTVVSDHIPHEITTFRKDVETDGRRAVVAFSTEVEDDARRRDFTMNALYANAEGEILDPLGGMIDVVNRRVRFIDDANQRIREDYLRILRFFRFHAWYGDPDGGMDPNALAAIADALDGIARLSKERVGYEMLRLLAAPDPAPSAAAMRATGALGAVLPGTDDRALAPLVHLEPMLDLQPDPIRRLAALGGGDPSDLLRLSRKNARALAELSDHIGGTESPEQLGYRLKAPAALSVLALRSAMLELPLPENAERSVRRGAAATFPVKPADLMPRLSGAELGATLKQLESRWIASGFSLDRDALLSSLG